MAKVIAEFEDVQGEGGKSEVTLKISQAEGEVATGMDLTDATLFGVTLKRMFETGVLGGLVGCIANDLIQMRRKEEAEAKVEYVVVDPVADEEVEYIT